MADSCLNIYICNNIRRFIEYKEIKPLQIQTGGGLIKAITIKLVKLTVARTDHSAYTIIFTKVYYCPNFFTNVVSLSVLRGKGAFFNSLHNTINFVKNQAEVAYIPCINGLNSFILLDDPVRLRLIEELPTKDAVPEVSRALQEGCKTSQTLQEEDEVSKASQSGGAAGDHDIAPQPNQPPLTDGELNCEPVVDNIKRFQDADELPKASLLGDDSQSGGTSGN
jgi:hypothetical protein